MCLLVKERVCLRVCVCVCVCVWAEVLEPGLASSSNAFISVVIDCFCLIQWIQWDWLLLSDTVDTVRLALIACEAQGHILGYCITQYV